MPMGRRKRQGHCVAALLPPLVILAMLLWFCVSLGNLDRGQDEKGREQLENSLRRAAVACYAAEGIYPPDTDYLQEHYGIQIDEGKYVVHYEIFAENLMPDITVLEK